MRDGGKGVDRKSAIFEILSYENRELYYDCKSTLNLTSKPQYLHINKKIKN